MPITRRDEGQPRFIDKYAPLSRHISLAPGIAGCYETVKGLITYNAQDLTLGFAVIVLAFGIYFSSTIARGLYALGRLGERRN